MKYFAYGSNMLESRMQERVLDAEFQHEAYIKGWKLAYNKLSIDGSSKLNLMRTGNLADKVWGKVYNVPRAQKLNLDAVEGKGKGYHIQRQRTAEDFLFFYVADDDAIVEGVLPYTWYVDLISAGVDSTEMPVRQREFLKQQYAQVDDDKERGLRNTCAITGDYSPLLELNNQTDTEDTVDLITNYTAGMLVRKYLIKRKYYRQVESVQFTMLEKLLVSLNALFNTQATISYDPDIVEYNGGGQVEYGTQHIVMSSLSIMTFIHEYGHVLQETHKLTVSDDVEIDAQEWSHTIFFIASPHMYLKAKSKGAFFHDDVRMVYPFCLFDETMPNDVVLKNRFYKYFDRFVMYVKQELTLFTVSDLLDIADNHASLTRHIRKIITV